MTRLRSEKPPTAAASRRRPLSGAERTSNPSDAYARRALAFSVYTESHRCVASCSRNARFASSATARRPIPLDFSPETMRFS